MNNKRITEIAIIGALYGGATIFCNIFMPGISWGPVQFRLSEALCFLALYNRNAISGLTIGCIVANVVNIVVAGTGFLGLLDVVFGSLATGLGAYFCWKFRARKIVALLSFVITNALIVPAYLPILLSYSGYYTIPFTNISLDGMWIYMYLFGVLSITISETVVVIGAGLSLSRLYEKINK